jgi:hypothetical protein
MLVERCFANKTAIPSLVALAYLSDNLRRRESVLMPEV